MKDFDGWHPIKKTLDTKIGLPSFAEREIWWCSVGVNIGYEVIGKDKRYTRPVLIFRKFGKHTFMGIPLTSRGKQGYFRYPYMFKGVNGSLLLDQVRSFDTRRLVAKMGKIHPNEFQKIKQAIKTCFKL